MNKTFVRNNLASPIYLENGEAIMNIGGNINLINGLNIPEWDSMTRTEDVPGTEVYTFTYDSVTVCTITVVYTDSTKETLATVTKS